VQLTSVAKRWLHVSSLGFASNSAVIVQVQVLQRTKVSWENKKRKAPTAVTINFE
jgi:hypothetical protein